MNSLNIDLKVQLRVRHCVIVGAALFGSLAINPLGQRAEAVVVLDNTPAPSGFNQFAAPSNPSDGGTYILTRGYAFQAGNLDYSIDSVSAYLYDVFDSSFNSIDPTARLELRSYDGSTPGQLLESLLVSITNTSANILSTFSVPAWNLSASSSYWIGLNWVSPYNQGNSTNASSALFGWSVASPSLPTMGSGFANLGFKQYVVGSNYPGGSWETIGCSIQCNTLRIDASVSQVPVPLPIFGFATAFAYSRKLRKRLRG
jgi:hypothetical protein